MQIFYARVIISLRIKLFIINYKYLWFLNNYFKINFKKITKEK